MDLAVPVSGRLTAPVGWSAAFHHHPHCELLLVDGGAMRVEMDADEVEATAGDLLLYPPGARHREHNPGRRPLELLYVHAAFAPIPGTGPRLVDLGGRLAQLVRWLVEDQAAGAPVEALAAWTRAIAVQIRAQSGTGARPLVDRVRAAMRAGLERHHTVPSLARAVGLGPRQLLRRYRDETGSTPMADLRRLRCEAAAALLVSSDWPLERIARAAGFCDAFHLSRVFRAHFGTPPGRMRLHGARRTPTAPRRL